MSATSIEVFLDIIGYELGLFGTLLIVLAFLRHRMWKIAKGDEPEIRSELSFLRLSRFIIFIYSKKPCNAKEIEAYRILARNTLNVTILVFLVELIMAFLFRNVK